MLVLDSNTISHDFKGDPAVVPQLQALRPSELEAAGTPIGPHDILIAATALRHQATLVTRKVREFARLPGLMWVNWHELGWGRWPGYICWVLRLGGFRPTAASSSAESGLRLSP